MFLAVAHIETWRHGARKGETGKHKTRYTDGLLDIDWSFGLDIHLVWAVVYELIDNTLRIVVSSHKCSILECKFRVHWSFHYIPT